MQQKIDLKKQKANRDLLVFDNKYSNPFGNKLDSSIDHKSYAIANLLNDEPEEKPQKPNFCEIAPSSIFAKLGQFLPRF
jgi:hypothetical protein